MPMGDIARQTGSDLGAWDSDDGEEENDEDDDDSDDEDGEFTPFKIDVIRVRDGKIAEVTTFGTAVFGELGLPAAL